MSEHTLNLLKLFFSLYSLHACAEKKKDLKLCDILWNKILDVVHRNETVKFVQCLEAGEEEKSLRDFWLEESFVGLNFQC